MPYKVAVIVGSLRKASLNLKVAKVLTELAPDTLACEFVPIDLPLYNEELEEAPPPAWTAFREQVGAAQALLFVSPEYNRSVPGALKNAIDVGSRPYGKAVWTGKPAAIVTVSPGAMGGFGANHHLRQSMVFLNVPVMQQPEAYLGGAGAFFDAEGRFVKDDTKAFLAKFMAAFAAWVATHAA